MKNSLSLDLVYYGYNNIYNFLTLTFLKYHSSHQNIQLLTFESKMLDFYSIHDASFKSTLYPPQSITLVFYWLSIS